MLVLDNCEHMVTACAELTEQLLQACARLHILATSREALGISGETVWQVFPLSLPGLRRPVTLKRLSESEAGRLFIERAHTIQRTFRTTSR